VRLSGRPKLETAVLDAARPEDYAPFRTAWIPRVRERGGAPRRRPGALRSMYETLEEQGRAVILAPEGRACQFAGSGNWDTAAYSKSSCAANERAGFVVEEMLRFNRISRPGCG